MKRLLKGIIWLMVACMLMSSAAFASGDDVEISFCVGDEILTINGESVTVQKPYVVGVGVTLVPLRVITEAFGAKVEWIASTRTVNLSYPDVNIVLQIGNPVAEVNGQAQTLLAAPELTGGSTMVPLRFISENFGAEVTYDNATRKITVIKKKSNENGETVIGNIDAKYIGDSYFGWTMEKPGDMVMEYRNFDGSYTAFAYDDNNWFDIEIVLVDEEYDFDRDFIETKNSLSGLTLVTADKVTSDSSRQIMHFQAKDKTGYMDAWKIVTAKRAYMLIGDFENEKAEWRDEAIRIMATFDNSYTGEDTYDLSKVKDGVRIYESENLNFSMNIPQEYYQASSENVENEVYFVKDDIDDTVSSIRLGIFSKSSAGSAEELANKDYTRNKSVMNPNLVKFSESVTTKQYKNFSAYEYSFDVKMSKTEYRSRDIFFELGDYVYNLNVDIKTPDANADAIIDSIANSLECKEIDSSEHGIFMRNDVDYEGTFTSKGTGWNITLPNSYEGQNDGSDAVYQNMSTGTVVSITCTAANGMTNSELKRTIKQIETDVRNTEGNRIKKATTDVKINNINYVGFEYEYTEDPIKIHVRTLVTVRNGKLITCIISIPELAYADVNIKEAEEILASFKFE